MYTKECQIAVEVMRQAAQMTREVRSDRSNPSAIWKPDDSPVTIADFAVQALVCRTLKAEFPEDAIVAEEDAAHLRLPDLNNVLEEVTGRLLPYIPNADANAVCDWVDLGNDVPAERFWVLDPVDGTRGFLRGDQYALALALIVNGRIVLGVLACPALTLQSNDPPGIICHAVRGKGTLVETENSDPAVRLELAESVESDRYRLLESVETDHNDRPRQEAIARSLGMTQPPIRVDSQAKYALLAAGMGALYLRLPQPEAVSRHEKIWDHAAGVLIVEEAGGRVTDLDGQPLDFSVGVELAANRGIVAGVTSAHAEAIRALSINGNRPD
ncbi:MAG: 3'(2'),5'-bisphosphate nucleotidase [Pelovirga sp.]